MKKAQEDPAAAAAAKIKVAEARTAARQAHWGRNLISFISVLEMHDPSPSSSFLFYRLKKAEEDPLAHAAAKAKVAKARTAARQVKEGCGYVSSVSQFI